MPSAWGRSILRLPVPAARLEPSAAARAFTRATGAQDVVMTGIDRYGFEFSVAVDGGRRPARIAFDTPIATAGDARKTLVALLAAARAAVAKGAAAAEDSG